MEKYRRVQKTSERGEIEPNEVRITSRGRIASYITYTLNTLEDKDFVRLVGMGRAISKVVTVAEIIKRRKPDLHQITEIGSTTVVDEYEPTEEGLEKVTSERTVSNISVKLSKDETAKENIGYQSPSNDEPEEQPPHRGGRGRGTRGRGRRGFRGRGRGRRGFRGRGRGEEFGEPKEE